MDFFANWEFVSIIYPRKVYIINCNGHDSFLRTLKATSDLRKLTQKFERLKALGN